MHGFHTHGLWRCNTRGSACRTADVRTNKYKSHHLRSPIQTNMPIVFELHGPTGRVFYTSFDYLPPWHDLASKIAPLYDTTPEVLSVSSMDDKESSVSVSSNDELRNFYRKYWRTNRGDGHPNLVKFAVHDTLASFGVDKPLPLTPIDGPLTALVHCDAGLPEHTKACSLSRPWAPRYTRPRRAVGPHQVVSKRPGHSFCTTALVSPSAVSIHMRVPEDRVFVQSAFPTATTSSRNPASQNQTNGQESSSPSSIS